MLSLSFIFPMENLHYFIMIFKNIPKKRKKQLLKNYSVTLDEDFKIFINICASFCSE